MAGSAAAILLLYLLYTKFFPIVSIWELEEEEERERKLFEQRCRELASEIESEPEPAGCE